MREGVEGLLRDKTRLPGQAPLPTGIVKRIVDLTLAEPPGETPLDGPRNGKGRRRQPALGTGGRWINSASAQGNELRYNHHRWTLFFLFDYDKTIVYMDTGNGADIDQIGLSNFTTYADYRSCYADYRSCL